MHFRVMRAFIPSADSCYQLCSSLGNFLTGDKPILWKKGEWSDQNTNVNLKMHQLRKI